MQYLTNMGEIMTGEPERVLKIPLIPKTPTIPVISKQMSALK